MPHVVPRTLVSRIFPYKFINALLCDSIAPSITEFIMQFSLFPFTYILFVILPYILSTLLSIYAASSTVKPSSTLMQDKATDNKI